MMNTVRKAENLLPFPVISAAANGDTTAMCAILKHYEGYIAKLCTRTLKDDAGNQSFVTKIRSISISSPCHFYFVLYCFIDFSCPCICPYQSS